MSYNSALKFDINPNKDQIIFLNDIIQILGKFENSIKGKIESMHKDRPKDLYNKLKRWEIAKDLNQIDDSEYNEILELNNIFFKELTNEQKSRFKFLKEKALLDKETKEKYTKEGVFKDHIKDLRKVELEKLFLQGRVSRKDIELELNPPAITKKSKKKDKSSSIKNKIYLSNWDRNELRISGDWPENSWWPFNSTGLTTIKSPNYEIGEAKYALHHNKITQEEYDFFIKIHSQYPEQRTKDDSKNFANIQKAINIRNTDDKKLAHELKFINPSECIRNLSNITSIKDQFMENIHKEWNYRSVHERALLQQIPAIILNKICGNIANSVITRKSKKRKLSEFNSLIWSNGRDLIEYINKKNIKFKFYKIAHIWAKKHQYMSYHRSDTDTKNKIVNKLLNIKIVNHYKIETKISEKKTKDISYVKSKKLLHSEMNGSISISTINDKWSMAIAIVSPIIPLIISTIPKTIGIDFGITRDVSEQFYINNPNRSIKWENKCKKMKIEPYRRIVITSKPINGIYVHIIKNLDYFDIKIDKLKSKKDKSENIEIKCKLERRINKLRRDKKNIKVRFWYDFSNALISEGYNDVKVENLNIKSMTGSAVGTELNPGSMVKQKAALNKRMLAHSPNFGYTVLQNKLKLINGKLTKVAKQYTSQTCSNCKYCHTMNRDATMFDCLNCGYKNDADINAAINIEFLSE